jgi:ankyrin repeat protein
VSLLRSNTHNPLLYRWWAHEHGRKEIISLLKSVGVSEKLRDKDGITPLELNDDEL